MPDNPLMAHNAPMIGKHADFGYAATAGLIRATVDLTVCANLLGSLETARLFYFVNKIKG